MTRRTKHAFDTPVAKRFGGKRQRAEGQPPPQADHPAPQRSRSAVGTFSIDFQGRVTPIKDKVQPRKHWARVPGISAIDGKIYRTWEEAHDHNSEEN